MTDYSRFRAETFRTEPSIVRPMRWASMAAIGLAATALAAEAQEWPAKPLTAVIPFAAGSVTDVVPRIVFEQLSKQLGQNIIVENRSGAGGTTAVTQVARSEPDGYTILVNSSAHTIAPALYPKVTYDAVRDFVAVAPLGIVPSIVVVPPDRGFKTLADFIAAAKHKPGAMNFASAGVGTATHLGAVRFQLSAGVRAVHVPFKGGPESMGEVIAGRIDYFLAPVGVALSHVKDGKLMALAVNAPKRIAALPEVPTMSEAGLVNAEYQFWIGMFLPAKTPRSIVDKLERETFKALASQSVKDKLRFWETYAVTAIAIALGILFVSSAHNWPHHYARTEHSTMAVCIVQFCVNGLSFAVVGTTPLAARHPVVRRFFDGNARRLTIADMQLTMIAQAFLWLSVSGIV